MSFFERNRPIVDSSRLLFEELEERVVLDASVDNALIGFDHLVSSPHACFNCLHQSSVSPQAEVTAPFPPEVSEAGRDGSVGRLYTDVDGFFGSLYTDEEFRDKIDTVLGDAADHSRDVAIASKLPEKPHGVYALQRPKLWTQ